MYRNEESIHSNGGNNKAVGSAVKVFLSLATWEHLNPLLSALYLRADGRRTTSSKSGQSEPAKTDLALPSAELDCREYLPKKATACQLFHWLFWHWL